MSKLVEVGRSRSKSVEVNDERPRLDSCSMQGTDQYRLPGAPAQMPLYGMGRDRRIRRRAEFQLVFDRGVRVQGRHMALLVAANEAGTPRLGIVASRKLGDAVRRNRAKRLIREVFRRTLSSSDRQGVDIVVIPRRELFDAPYSTLETDFRDALRRCAGRLSAQSR